MSSAYKNKIKTRAKINHVSVAQRLAILDYFEKRKKNQRNLSRKILSGRKTWTRLSRKLNEMEGMPKTAEKWNKFFSNWSLYTRKRIEQLLGTEGNIKKPTSIQERILRLTGYDHLLNKCYLTGTQLKEDDKMDIIKQIQLDLDSNEDFDLVYVDDDEEVVEEMKINVDVIKCIDSDIGDINVDCLPYQKQTCSLNKICAMYIEKMLDNIPLEDQADARAEVHAAVSKIEVQFSKKRHVDNKLFLSST